MTVPVLNASNVTKSLGGTPIIGGLTLSAEQGEFISVVGPSGCGKTTLLTCLSGLRNVDAGEVSFEGQKLDGPPDGMALIFQDYSRSLLPWRRNVDNVLFGMRRMTGVSAQEKRAKAMEMLAAVGLSKFETHFPWQVSGGMQQRVAIARALAARPHLLLLDEPLAAVDAQTRADIQDLLLSLARQFQKTCLLVTHDVDEAIYMADRVIVLSNRPTHVIADLQVPLPKPRDQIATRSEPEFLRLREKVLTLIRSMRIAA